MFEELANFPGNIDLQLNDVLAFGHRHGAVGRLHALGLAVKGDGRGMHVLENADDFAKRDPCALGIELRLAAGVGNGKPARLIFERLWIIDRKGDAVDLV